jgi:hypothetical protein
MHRHDAPKETRPESAGPAARRGSRRSSRRPRRRAPRTSPSSAGARLACGDRMQRRDRRPVHRRLGTTHRVRRAPLRVAASRSFAVTWTAGPGSCCHRTGMLGSGSMSTAEAPGGWTGARCTTSSGPTALVGSGSGPMVSRQPDNLAPTCDHTPLLVSSPSDLRDRRSLIVHGQRRLGRWEPVDCYPLTPGRQVTDRQPVRLSLGPGWLGLGDWYPYRRLG